MDRETIIEFENFGFQYDAQAEPTLYDINFRIKKGEKVLICGTSGCGKSTLSHCINGLIPHAYKGKMTGSLKVKGQDVSNLGIFELSQIVGTVLQDSDGQFVGLTVAEDIAFALENDCIPTEELRSEVLKIAEVVDVTRVLHHAPHEISGGQKQRVGIGGVMVNDVDLMLFDEPLANLDPATGKQAISLIEEIAERCDCSVIIIEHRIEDVLYKKVDRVVVMDSGRICYDGTPDDLLCTDLLQKKGIREPLYITALKYAGVKLTSSMNPAFLPELILNEEQKLRVRQWNNSFSEENEPAVNMQLLQVKSLNFTYDNGHHALKNITTTINKGEIVSIVGTNGAGKSTFSKVICGFEKNQSGSITFDDIDLSGFSIKERADKIGYVMQNPNQMISEIMIYDEVALGLRNRGIDELTIKTKVEKALKVCGLYPYRNWPVSALSYGQKKRVTICSILVLEPQMIILDEPTAGQDLKHYTEIMEFLIELNHQGITIAFITHDMHLMLEYTPRAIVFNDGQIIADDSSVNILNNLEVIEKAHLKETSLYHLSKLCDIDNKESLSRNFIKHDKEVRL